MADVQVRRRFQTTFDASGKRKKLRRPCSHTRTTSCACSSRCRCYLLVTGGYINVSTLLPSFASTLFWATENDQYPRQDGTCGTRKRQNTVSPPALISICRRPIIFRASTDDALAGQRLLILHSRVVRVTYPFRLGDCSRRAHSKLIELGHMTRPHTPLFRRQTVAASSLTLITNSCVC